MPVQACVCRRTAEDRGETPRWPGPSIGWEEHYKQAATFTTLLISRYDTVRMTDQTTSSIIEASQELYTEGREL
jgi:hypothetical protein